VPNIAPNDTGSKKTYLQGGDEGFLVSLEKSVLGLLGLPS
jgi:hypothetical protein